MTKFNELLEKLKSLEIIQQEMDWDENIPQDIWDEYFLNNYNELKSGLHVDSHRHYEMSTSVIEVSGGLLGIKHITNVYSESCGVEDCYVEMEFMEMKEVQIISYEPK
jgi:hypothetical protein